VTPVTDVLLPTSPDEAVAAFGDGGDVTVIGGGTILMPEINAGRVRPTRAILLARAGLANVSREGSSVTIGAATSLEDLVDLAAPIGPCAANIGDVEVRSQATLGGNVCAGEGAHVPRGDLQAPLLALGAVARSAGPGGVATEALEEFLRHRSGRLLLDVTYDEPAAGAFVALDRAHTHEYTAMAVAAARLAGGEIRIAATGTGSGGMRLPSAEAAAADPEAAGEAALADVTLHDDALASAWYRSKALPVLVRRALTQLEEA
jgi:carbon-monoxide dehydrogenase medium subunit